MLTTAQIATLKADILANSDTNTQPMSSSGNFAIQALYNVASSTDVWRTEAPIDAIYDALDWSKYTMADAADSTVLQTNRLLQIQTKQMNLQNMLQGRSTVNAAKANLRAGLRDAVVALPAGVGGAAVSVAGASGVTVLTACTRKANRYEKLYATTQATTGTVTANLLVVEGVLSVDDIQLARES